MTPAECLADALSLLPSIPSARAFTISASALESPPPPHTHLPPAPVDTLQTPPPPAPQLQPTRPALHILCRDSSSSSAAFAPIDNLGKTGALSGAGYFELEGGRGSLHVIADRVRSRGALQTLLAHELVHALDACVFGLDLRVCGALACSEVRAAAAADCTAETGTPFWWRSRCTRNTATASASMVFPEQGAACVRAVFDSCQPLAPFDNPLPAVARLLDGERLAVAAAAAGEAAAGR